MKKIAILGISGSIGTSAVKICRNHPDEFQIVFASVYNNIDTLKTYALEFNIKNLHIGNETLKAKNQTIFEGNNVFWGEEELQRALENLDYDILLNAISGSAGLKSSVTAIKNNKILALANKESLIMAGHLIMPKVKENKGILLPVDSEHSAILQCLSNHSPSEVKKLIITASGGSFRDVPISDLDKMTPQASLNHPTWDMGKKITIDSATMMNKGLEVIEAHWLFDMPYEKIQAIIHPQSIIHSLVEFNDGSIISQMSVPSMELPILYAFTYPKHIPSQNVKTDLLNIPELTFKEVCFNRYPHFKLALEVGKEGGILPTIMNASNEATINLFLEHKIKYTDMFKILDRYLQHYENISSPDLETILEQNKNTYFDVYENYNNFLN